MRILFITENYGETAPGIVAKKLVTGLSQYSLVDVVTSSKGENTESISLTTIPIFSKFKFVKWSYLVFGTNLLSVPWEILAYTSIDKKKKYDLVFSIASMWHLSALKISSRLVSHFQCPFYSYFVDAIPAPYPYLTSNRIRKVFQRIVDNHTKGADIIYSTSREMSEFQKSIMPGRKIQFKELLNPSESSTLQDIGKPESKTFLYTGKIYPPRNVGYLLKAFARLVKSDPDVRLCFVGSDLPFDLRTLGKDSSSRISCVDYQKDLSVFFKDCCCCIDVACDVHNDIFVSSKFPVYLSYNRPIISESSIGSPTRRLFGNLESVYICGHNEDELFCAMKDVLQRSNNYHFVERNAILEKFFIRGVVESILKDLNKL